MKKGLTVVIGLLLVFSAFSIQMNPFGVKGDIYVVTSEIEGITFHNGTGISMPQANVSINITRAANRLIDISFMGRYAIETTTRQNTTLAFVYSNYHSQENFENYSICLNGSAINYTIYEWEELGFEYPSDVVDMTGTWVVNAKYATFNAEFLENTSSIIHVTHQETFPSYGNEFWYNYIVESARSFSGTTHQNIHIKLVEEEPFLETEFLPDIFLTQWHENNTTHAVWDFIVQETSIEEVRMQAVSATYHGDIRPDKSENNIPDVYEPPLTLLGIAALVIAIGTIYLKKYH